MLAICLTISVVVVSASAADSADSVFAGANLNLNEGIAIQFLAYPEAVEEYDSSYLSVKYLDRDDTLLTKEIEGVEYTFNDKDYILYRFDAVSPDRMADVVNATLYGVKGGNDTQIGDTITYSVKQYVTNTYASTTDAMLKTLLADILYYGEKARLYTLASGIGTNETPIYSASDCSWVEDARTKGDLIDEELVSVKNLTDFANAHVEWTSVGLNLRENPAILYKFKLTNKASGVSNYKLVVEVEGQEKFEYQLSAADYNKSERCYVYRFRGLNPTKMGETVSAYFVDGSGNKVSATLDYSVESFAKFCYDETNGGTAFTSTITEELYELIEALLAYGSSVIEYFENVNDLSTIIVYPEYDERIERDYTYDVKVVQETPNGDVSKDLVCYNHTDAVATSVRTVNGDMYRRFCEFAFAKDENMPVRVDITVYSDFDSYTVMPSAKNFTSTRNGNVISVYLDKPDYFLLKLDASDDSILAVFADEPETDVPSKDDENVIYVEGWYEPENSTVLNVTKDNAILYLAPGSVLNARVKIKGNNVTVKGRGMILDPYSDIYKTDASEAGPGTATGTDKRYLLHVTGSNCTVDGIKMIDSRDFNLWVQSTGLKCTNLKILSSEMCTDGITTHSNCSNASFKHCFLYVADNALVLSTSTTTSVFDDITIGTICCGIFPQNNAGKYEISNIYIFRADEGIMRNCYNWNSEQRSFSLTLNNVSAVDCDHFPFIFYGWNMGTAAKTITFNNLAVPVATGSEVLGQGDGSTIRVENVSGYLETNNYTFNFNGLSIGGKAITSANDIPKNITKKVTTQWWGGTTEEDANYINVSGSGSSFGPASPKTISGSVKPEGKIFIGERQLFAKDRAINKNGTWYVPAADVCAAVGKDVPSATTTINKVKYISLANLTSSGVAKSASYDSSSGRIKIGVPSGTTGDLFSWFGNSAHSHWAEHVCYNMHMVWLEEYGGNSFRMEDCSNYAGISYNLTPQMQQYGTGKYTMTFEAKADVDSSKLAIAFRTNGSDAWFTQTLSTDWKKVTITLTNNVDPASIKNACIYMQASADNQGIEIKNAKLTYTVAK